MSEALLDAIEQANLEEIQFILSSGLNANKPLPHGQTPLNLAIALGLNHICTGLIEAGASVHQSDSFRYDECRRRPIHYAAATCNLTLLKLLLDAGVSIDEEDYGSSTAIHHAAANGHKDIVEFLLSQGANVNHTSKSGRSALWKAAQTGHRSIVLLLHKNGASINLQNRVGQSVLFDCIRNSYRITRDLVEAGVKLHLRDVEGNSVLHAASMLGKTPAIQMLIDNGATIYSYNEYRNTPLHNASMHDRLVSTACLLNNCQKYNMQNLNGQSAMYLTMVHKHHRVTELLHIAGAKLSTRELHMYKDFESQKYEEKFRFFEWAYALFISPMSLADITRIAIRTTFKDCAYNSVGFLPIPMVLKRFLLFGDIVSDSVIVQNLFSKTDEPSSGSDCEEEDEVVCDVCDKLLSAESGATWYKCTACDDYDLCKSCRNNQAHVEHRDQLHAFKYHGPNSGEGCFSCGKLIKDIRDQENVMYTCPLCEDIMMCHDCVLDGMHRRHRDKLKVSCATVNE